MSESCADCKFSCRHDDGFACRRYPPRALVLTLQSPGNGYDCKAEHRFEAKFPEVNPRGWCGEYQRQIGSRRP